MELETKIDYAPETVKNFVSLAYRGYYDGTIIHRIVKSPNFGVIQGGDKEKANGTGGKSAKWISETEPNNVPDEVWNVKPEFAGQGENTKLINNPVFKAPQFYTNFDPNTGQVTYPKGTILMAKTQKPDSASSQFFINLVDTTLPAQYTAFGTIKDTTVLDKISAEVNPLDKQTGKETSDGIPNKEIKINKISLKN
jgi:cyclophilin family peptidyl-prolyl cis-trans isomerase